MKQFILTYPEEKILMLDCFCKKSGITRSMFFRNLLDDWMVENRKTIYHTIKDIA